MGKNTYAVHNEEWDSFEVSIERNWSAINRTISAELERLGEFSKAALPRSFAKRKEYGRGNWGIALATNSKRWVVKVSFDPTEGWIIQNIISNDVLRLHPGICYYAGVWQLPKAENAKSTKRARGKTIWVVLHENIEPIPGIDEITEEEFKKWKGRNKWAENLSSVRTQAELTNSAIALGNEELAEKYGMGLGSALRKLEKTEETRNIARFMSLYSQQIESALADVHVGNIGHRQFSFARFDTVAKKKKVLSELVPDKKKLVIFDPGHSFIDWAPPIKIIRNPCCPIPIIGERNA